MATDPTSNKAPVAVLEYEPSAFEMTLLKHKSKLILVGVIAILGTVAYWGYRLYKEATHKSAAVEFTRAETVEDLKKVAAAHAAQTAGGDATILAAEYVSTERPKEAVAMLQELLKKSPDHPLAALASWRIAEYHALAGDTTGAEKEYEAVAKAGTPFSAFALLRLGDLKWGAGDTAKAQENYDRILRNGALSGSPVRALAQKRMETDLKITPPVVVEYKEEPPPPVPGAPKPAIPGLGNIPGLLDPDDSLLPSLDLSEPAPLPDPAPPLPPPPSPPPDPAPEPAPPAEPAPDRPEATPKETPTPPPATPPDPAAPSGSKPPKKKAE